MSVVILSAIRTPIGSFGGCLKKISAVDLATAVIREAVKRSQIPSDRMAEIIMGQVFQAGSGPNLARQAAIQAEIPVEVPAYTPNHLCASGLKAIALAVQNLEAGEGDFAVAGGVESMSNVPYLLPTARWGHRMGATELRDALLQDGLQCPLTGNSMGGLMEAVAQRLGISREAQDAFALGSQCKAAAAAPHFGREIVPLAILDRKGPREIRLDEPPKPQSTMEDLARLAPAFQKDGTITAGNASPLSDGAAAVTLARESALRKGTPMARILGFAQVGLDPAQMGLGPVAAIRKLISKTNLQIQDIDRFELNEAFAAQTLAVLQELPEIDPKKVNVRGGAIALGHPVGASGARILVTLIHTLRDEGLRYGLAALCVGGGQGVAMLIERL